MSNRMRRRQQNQVAGADRIRCAWQTLTAVVAAVLTIIIGIVPWGVVYADSSSSAHWQVNEVQFGGGGIQNACSTTYCSDQSAGDTVVGNTKSSSYQAYGGFNTTTDPYLEVWAEGGTADLGTLTVDTTATASNVIKVRSYLSNGYVIQITGSSPSQGTHALTPMGTPATSHAGAEQFGINMAANTAPSIGAAPVQVPDGGVSFGYVTDDYATPNLFKYNPNDIVAQSDTSSGETDYTLSMIINISNVTAGGKYTGALSAVVVPVY